MSDKPDQEQETPAEKSDVTKQESEPQPPPMPTIPKTQLQCKNPQKEDTDKDHGDRLQRSYLKVQIGLLIATTLAFIAAAIYAGIAYQQWCTMGDTFKEIKKQTEASQKSADAATKAVAVAKDTLRASIEMARQDQRAWVGPVKVLPVWREPTGKPIFIKEGFAPKFEVVVTNSGKSPARKVRISIKFDTVPADKKVSPNYGLPQKQSVAVIQPQQIFTMAVSSPQPISVVGVDNIKNRKSILYLFGKITYEDIFKIQHSTTFCMTLDPSLDAFNSCDAYNDTD